MNALFVGAGKNLGLALIRHLRSEEHKVYHITGSTVDADVDDLIVDWSQVRETNLHRWLASLPYIDLVFYNQNSSSLNQSSFEPGQYTVLELWKQMTHWQQSHYVSCQLPFQIIHTLGNRLSRTSRVCWMLSCMVVRHKHDPGHADYIANKFQNYLMVKNFARSHPSCFFGIDPGRSVRAQDHAGSLAQFHGLLQIPCQEANGNIYNMDGTVSQLYRMFT